MIIIDWKPDTAALRKFGRSMLIFGLLFAGWFWYRNAPTTAWTLFCLGAFCFLTSCFMPAVARVAYGLWMGIAWLLSQIVTPLIMGILYFLVITPIGIVLKFTGHDRLRLKKPQAASFWAECRRSPSYDRQF